MSAEILKQYISLLRQQLKMQQNIKLRQLTARDHDSNPEVYRSGSAFGESKEVYRSGNHSFGESKDESRRRLGPQALVFEVTYYEE